MDRQTKEKTDRTTPTKTDDVWVAYTMLRWWWCQVSGKKCFYSEGLDSDIGMCHAAENCTVVLGNFCAGSGIFP